jgi:hypothetical protein
MTPLVCPRQHLLPWRATVRKSGTHIPDSVRLAQEPRSVPDGHQQEDGSQRGRRLYIAQGRNVPHDCQVAVCHVHVQTSLVEGPFSCAHWLALLSCECLLFSARSCLCVTTVNPPSSEHPLPYTAVFTRKLSWCQIAHTLRQHTPTLIRMEECFEKTCLVLEVDSLDVAVVLQRDAKGKRRKEEERKRKPRGTRGEQSRPSNTG